MNYKFYYDNHDGQDDYGLKYIDENGYGYKCTKYKVEFPPQEQDVQPGMEYIMEPKPIFDYQNYKASGKLKGKVAIITGGDSGLADLLQFILLRKAQKSLLFILMNIKMLKIQRLT